MRGSSGSVQKIVKIKTPRRRRAKEEEDDDDDDEEEDEVFNEKYYIQALGSDNTEADEAGVAGAAVFTFQKNKRSHGMAHTASELARTPGKSVTFSVSSDQEISPIRATPTRATPTRATPTRATPTRATPTRATPTRATPTRATPTRASPTRAPPTRATPSRATRSNNSESHTPQKGNKVQFVSTTPYRLRKRITIPDLRSDSDSELSPSDSGGEGEEEEEEDDDDDENEEEVGDGEKTKKENKKIVKHPKPPSKTQAAALYKTPAKKSKNVPEPLNQPSLVEEYFEAHGSSKVLTSDRTLQRLKTPKLDRDTLFGLLENRPSCYSSEIQRLHNKYQKHFSKWMLQLQLGFSVLVYGLGSKKALLEDFRLTQLSQEIHLVVNGFFPSITLKSILNAITSEALEHQGTFRNPSDQIQCIAQTLKDSPDIHVYLLIHNIDGPMLRGEKTQSALGQLASIPNLHLIASIDHINAPLVWDQCKQSQFNWLWWECVTFRRYAEETSYENSLLVQQTGALALSSLTHVLRSLTSNARGIFKLLVEFQLENKDNTSYTGLSFQDFYQRCREAFLVNSDLTLRTQLTEFRDHKLIRTRKGADGVEYLLVPVETSTLMDFLEKEELE